MNLKQSDVRATVKTENVCGPGFTVREIDIERVGVVAAPFEMSLFTVESGHSSVPEAHSDAEIWIILRGQGKLTLGGRVLRVASGDVLKLSPEIQHSVFNDGNGPLLINSIWWS